MKNERQEKILQILKDKKFVKSVELKDMFNVSMETIRRDLEKLEDEGLLTRVYGGAAPKSLYGIEPEYEGRGVKNFEQKHMIARKAADMVEEGDTLIIDVGTTALEFARQLAGRKNLTVFTNSIPVVMELKKTEGIRVYMIGGEIRSGELSSSGFVAEQMIENFFVDKLFIGIGGISIEHGICDYHIGEANLRRVFIKHARRVIGLADYSKFDVTALNYICDVNALDCLVTDNQANSQALKSLAARGIKVVVAEPEEKFWTGKRN